MPDRYRKTMKYLPVVLALLAIIMVVQLFVFDFLSSVVASSIEAILLASDVGEGIFSEFLIEWAYRAELVALLSAIPAVLSVLSAAIFFSQNEILQLIRTRPVVSLIVLILLLSLPFYFYLYAPDNVTVRPPLSSKPLRKLPGGGQTPSATPDGAVEGQPSKPIHYPSTTAAPALGIVCHTDGGDNVLSNPRGAEVTGVTTGSVADKAGLRQGDVILKINGKVVKDSADCRMAENDGEHPVSVDILRQGQVQTVLLLGVQPR